MNRRKGKGKRRRTQKEKREADKPILRSAGRNFSTVDNIPDLFGERRRTKQREKKAR